jgi:phenylacetate-CoA ligase
MGYLLEQAYPFLPVSLQNLGISAFGYFWHKRRFGGVFKNELRKFKDRESFTYEQWSDYQLQELRKFLAHAYMNVPFYREKYRQAGLSENDLSTIQRLDQLSKLPLLEKDELRKFGTTSLMAGNKRKGTFFGSSGSTGTPTRIFFSDYMHQRWSAGFEARIRHWAGVSKDLSRGMIGGRRILPSGTSRPPFYRYNFVEKQVYFSAYHISPTTAPNYLEAIRRYDLDYMTGYAASNFFLARFLDEAKLEVPPLKAVITSSEKLTKEMRQTLEKVYQCKAYDSYSGIEACGLISECEHGSLHVSPDMGIIEFLRPDGSPALPGEVAEMVCTGILNYDQPLIRYRIGDLAVLSDRICKCGRQLPVVQEIIGRIEDTVVGIDGREMVRFHGIFIDLPHVLEAQVVQEDYSSLTINVVPNGKISIQEQNIIRDRILSQLGKVNVSINEVESIPRGPNGKFKAVISKVKRQPQNK